MSLAFIAKHNGEEAAKEVAAYLEYSGDWRHAPIHMPLIQNYFAVVLSLSSVLLQGSHKRPLLPHH